MALRSFFCLVCACVVIGLLGAAGTGFIVNYIPVQSLHPERPQHDSRAITGYGVPFVFWVPDDSIPEIPSHQARFLAGAFIVDACGFGVLAAMVLLPLWLMVWLAAYLLLCRDRAALARHTP